MKQHSVQVRQCLVLSPQYFTKLEIFNFEVGQDEMLDQEVRISWVLFYDIRIQVRVDVNLSEVTSNLLILPLLTNLHRKSISSN